MIRLELALGLLLSLAPAAAADDAIARRIAELTSDARERRARAVAALGQLGPSAAPRLSAVIPLARHRDPGVRGAAFEVLGAVGVVSSASRTALIAGLGDPEVRAQLRAAEALAAVGVARPTTAAALERLLSETVLALRDRSDPVGSEAWHRRRQLLVRVAAALGSARRPGSLPALRAAFAAYPHDRIAVRIAALPAAAGRRFALALVADPRASLRTRLAVGRRLLHGASAEVRRALRPADRLLDACLHAWLFGSLEPEGIARLRRGLSLKTSRLVEQAASALGALGPRATPALPELARLVDERSEHPDEARSALRALGRIGAPAASAMPQLLGALTCDLADTDRRLIRGDAAEALGRIGKKTPAIVQGMVQILRQRLWIDGDQPWVQASLALGRLKAKEATAVLLTAIDQGGEDEYTNPWRRWAAVEGLGLIGPGAKLAVPRLKELAEVTDLSGAHALLALRRIVGSSRTQPLLAGLRRLGAREGLAIAPGLLDLKEPAVTAAVPALLREALRDLPLDERLKVIPLAARLGPVGKPILEGVRRDDPHFEAREAAELALRR